MMTESEINRRLAEIAAMKPEMPGTFDPRRVVRTYFSASVPQAERDAALADLAAGAVPENLTPHMRPTQ